MPLVVRCPDCEKSYRVPETMAGKKVKCKACNSSITVPTQDEEEVLDIEPTPQPARQPLKKTPVESPVPTPQAKRPAVEFDDDDEEKEDRPGKKKAQPKDLKEKLQELSKTPGYQKWGSAIGFIFVSCIFFAGSIAFYSKFAALEKGETIEVEEVIADVYEAVGKWPIIITFLLIGIVMLAAGIRAMMRPVDAEIFKKKPKEE